MRRGDASMNNFIQTTFLTACPNCIAHQNEIYTLSKSVEINPNQAMMGRIPPQAHSTACHFEFRAVISVKMQCKFLLRCLKQVDNTNVRGCVWKCFENLDFWTKMPWKMRQNFFKNSYYANCFITNFIFWCQIWI